MKRAFFIFCLAACGPSASRPSTTFASYIDGRLTAVSTGTTATIAVSAPHASCVQSGTCIAPAIDPLYCPVLSSPADLLIVGGALAHTFCYPTTSVLTVSGTTAGDYLVAQAGAVVTFNSNTDDVVFGGKLDVEADDIVIYGNGPQSTLFTGDLLVHGKNVKIRGVRIGGSVVSDHPLSLAFSTINSSAVMPAGSSLLETLVLGSLTMTGGVLAQSEVQGSFTVSGTECTNNRHVDDLNQDGLIDQDELGSPLTCSDP